MSMKWYFIIWYATEGNYRNRICNKISKYKNKTVNKINLKLQRVQQSIFTKGCKIIYILCFINISTVDLQNLKIISRDTYNICNASQWYISGANHMITRTPNVLPSKNIQFVGAPKLLLPPIKVPTLSPIMALEMLPGLLKLKTTTGLQKRKHQQWVKHALLVGFRNRVTLRK